jgi:uncharacterized phage-like protein YoqJ
VSDFVIAGTGHRPPRLGLGYDPESNRLLTGFATQALGTYVFAGNVTAVISGGAQGWDQALAHAAIRLGIPLTVAVPFEGQESKWPAAGRKRYLAILAKAKEVVVVSQGGYANHKFYARDQWMVDHANLVLALLDGKPQRSGTRLTVEYANGRGVPVVNGWADWESFKARHGVVSRGGTTTPEASDGDGTRRIRQAAGSEEVA